MKSIINKKIYLVALLFIAMIVCYFLFSDSQPSEDVLDTGTWPGPKVVEKFKPNSIEDNHSKLVQKEAESKSWLAHLAPEYQGVGAANWWKAPITFYGIVVDEEGRQLSGAQIKIIISDISRSGTSEYILQSAKDGIFVFEGKKGRGISVYVEKMGYYNTSSSVRHFNYGGEGLSKAFRPDPTKPEIFVLYKKTEGVPLLSVEGNVSLPKDGSAVEISLITGRRATKGEGDILVGLYTQINDKNPHAQYPWQYHIVVPGGGLFETSNEFAFMAPEDGYSPKLVRGFKPGDAAWKDSEHVYSYIKNRHGQYAYVIIYFIPGGDHFVNIVSKLNPSGSRQLEPSEKFFYESVYRRDGLREFLLKERNYIFK